MEKTKHFLFVTVLVMTLLFVDSAVEARADVEAVEALGKLKSIKTAVRGEALIFYQFPCLK